MCKPPVFMPTDKLPGVLRFAGDAYSLLRSPPPKFNIPAPGDLRLPGDGVCCPGNGGGSNDREVARPEDFDFGGKGRELGYGPLPMVESSEGGGSPGEGFALLYGLPLLPYPPLVGGIRVGAPSVEYLPNALAPTGRDEFEDTDEIMLLVRPALLNPLRVELPREWYGEPTVKPEFGVRTPGTSPSGLE